jgi:hypothetical protein
MVSRSSIFQIVFPTFFMSTQELSIVTQEPWEWEGEGSLVRGNSFNENMLNNKKKYI